MWQIDNRTPFAAERAWVRDRNGAEIWLVAVRCAFDIAPDRATMISEEQTPPVLAPEYVGEPGRSSLRFDTDLSRTKVATDVILHGHAHAPGGRMVKELEVGLMVGPVRKFLRVTGDRRWRIGATGMSMSNPAPFAKIPLVYERAYGGADAFACDDARPAWDMRNPVGCGYALKESNLEGVPAPNIEYPQFSVEKWDDRPPPAGFGPVSSHWQPRASFAGTYDEQWMKSRMPLPPEDFDDRFFQCAPADQQAPGFLSGGEPVFLRNLSPGGDLRFHVPRVIIGFETEFYDGARVTHKPPRLHTIVLEPDFPRISLVWHTALPCHSRVRGLKRTIIWIKELLPKGETFDGASLEEEE